MAIYARNRGHIETPADGEPAPRTGKWLQKDVPHYGWEFVDWVDLYPAADDYVDNFIVGHDVFICEMCEKAEIRYVHVMRHPDYADELDCGCICAGFMEANHEQAKLREQIGFKRRNELRKSFKTGPLGKQYLYVEGFSITVMPLNGGWVYSVQKMLNAWVIAAGHCSVESDEVFASPDEAKRAVRRRMSRMSFYGGKG